MSNSKLKNKTVEPSVQEVQCPVSGIYFSSIGVDVHAQILVCHSQRYDPDSKSLFESDVRFGTSRQQLELFAQWIIEKDPEVVLMESTGVYWFSPYEALEQAGFNTDSIKVVKATEVKAAKGRKTDKVDAKRLSEFARMGSFHNSFIPTKAVREARQIGRALHKATQDCARYSNRLHKLFSASGSRLSSVFSDINGKTATKIIEAYLDKEWPEFVSVVRKLNSRLKADFEDILDAFAHVSPQMKTLLKEVRGQLIQAKSYRDRLEELLRDSLMPYSKLVSRLTAIPGVKELSALKIVSEIGEDLSKFRNIEAFCSWIGICSGNNESAGKRKSGSSPKGNPYLRTYLAEVGQAIGLMKTTETQLRVCFQALKERRGHNRAVIAIGHKVARAIYAMITKDEPYVEKDCHTLKAVRLARLVSSIRKAPEVELEVNGTSVVDLKSGQIYET